MLEVLKEPYVSLFIIMFFGVLISKLELKKIGFGSSGIVISAIFFGYFGMKTPLFIEKIGLILFIFAVGIQAGPGFFESFKTGEARQYLKSTIITLGIITLITFSITSILGFDSFFLAGLFSGITTSTPALAAIIENGHSSTPLVTYSIAYPVALVTTVFTVRIISKYLYIDVALEEKKYRQEFSSKRTKVNTGYFIINNPNIYGKSIHDVNFPAITNSTISRIKREDEDDSFIPIKKTILKEKDLIKVIGDEESLKTISIVLGKETNKEIETSSEEEIISVLVTKPQIIGKPLLDLNLNTLWGAEVREIRRAGVNILPTGSTRLRFGDKVLVSVKKASASNLIKMLGGVESNSIDFLPISIAIVLGVLIGQITVSFGESRIGPGVTGGILFTTLILGRIGKTGPMLWSIAGKTNQFLREIGIMFFLCGVGSSTGQSLLKSYTNEGLKIIIATIFITISSILLTSFISIKYFKMNRLRFLGALAGSFTCSAALPDPEEVNNSSIPLTAYSVTYPFALLLTILIGQLLLFL